MLRATIRPLWVCAAAAVAVTLLVAGCEETENAPTSKPAESAPAAAPGTAAEQPTAPPFAGAGAAAAAPPAAAGAPFGGAAKMSPAQALAHVPSLDPALAPLKRSYDKAAADLTHRPDDAAAKKAYVDSAYEYGHAIEYSNAINDPPIKYRASLLLYRNALKVDPNNQPSKTELDQIESIYKSMGMPVPR